MRSTRSSTSSWPGPRRSIPARPCAAETRRPTSSGPAPGRRRAARRQRLRARHGITLTLAGSRALCHALTCRPSDVTRAPGKKPGEFCDRVRDIDAAVAVPIEKGGIPTVLRVPIPTGKTPRVAEEKEAEEADAIGNIQLAVLVHVARDLAAQIARHIHGERAAEPLPIGVNGRGLDGGGSYREDRARGGDTVDPWRPGAVIACHDLEGDRRAL